ncbi:hypothetical protein BZM27_22790 [Paraburkholderia steynii]|uniref:Uncharacterized protein n=1 Tax=Paraburkholderia steynii TaxID=1245441 RepID=A0A4R0XI25_9BURK|nr:hypothetical protein BZM27_22790 [Paraburkholderia steynii]
METLELAPLVHTDRRGVAFGLVRQNSTSELLIMTGFMSSGRIRLAAPALPRIARIADRPLPTFR